MTVEQVRHDITPILRKHGALKAILFGSLSRGTHDEKSDIDLIIVDDKPVRYMDRLNEYYDDLVDELKCGLDLFVYTTEEFQRMKKQPFLRRALQEGSVLYEC